LEIGKEEEILAQKPPQALKKEDLHLRSVLIIFPRDLNGFWAKGLGRGDHEQ
jgi:hypothetical protein